MFPCFGSQGIFSVRGYIPPFFNDFLFKKYLYDVLKVQLTVLISLSKLHTGKDEMLVYACWSLDNLWMLCFILTFLVKGSYFGVWRLNKAFPYIRDRSNTVRDSRVVFYWKSLIQTNREYSILKNETKLFIQYID